MRKLSVLIVCVLLLSLGLSACSPAAPAETAVPESAAEPTKAPAADAEPTKDLPQHTAGRLILATTTSTQDSGLLDDILPDFEKEFGVKVDVIAVGSGEAMRLGQAGDADVLLVHSPKAEKEYMDGGHGTRREDVMYNDFVIIGPADDPVGIKGMSVADALRMLADSGAEFLSRADKSGTNAKEIALWEANGIDPNSAFIVKTGLGMGDLLTMAQEKQAYTLSDRATYLSRVKGGLDLVVLVEGDKALFNPYGVITVNPEKNDMIQADLATKFVDWIISVPVQEKISQYGVEEYGGALFTPDSALWRESKGQ